MNNGADHPDRRAQTLAQRGAATRSEPASTPAPGDARIDLRLLRHAADRALATRGTDAARAWLVGLDSPDLRAGTIQDGTARGLMARLEEAISLCEPESDAAADPLDPTDALAEIAAAPITGRELRRRREVLIASGGVRVRFSRKQGIHIIDRDRDLNLTHCIQFDDQADAGCLDGFRPPPEAPMRVFSPAFLRPECLVQSAAVDYLVLTGRLGRTGSGFPCRIVLSGHKNEAGIRMRVQIENRHENHRLRIRFHEIEDPAFLSSRGTPEFAAIDHPRGKFLAATLVRACGSLRVGEDWVATPGAQVQGTVEHHFGLGMTV